MKKKKKKRKGEEEWRAKWVDSYRTVVVVVVVVVVIWEGSNESREYFIDSPGFSANSSPVYEREMVADGEE